MNKLMATALTVCITLSNLHLFAAGVCYSWIALPYTAGHTTASYLVDTQYLGCHKVQRWALKDGKLEKDEDGNVASEKATSNGGYYWEGTFNGHCRLRNYLSNNQQLLTTRFMSPQQANNGSDYTAAVRPSGSNKLQKYSLPGTAKDGEVSTKDNKSTPATSVTVTN